MPRSLRGTRKAVRKSLDGFFLKIGSPLYCCEVVRLIGLSVAGLFPAWYRRPDGGDGLSVFPRWKVPDAQPAMKRRGWVPTMR